MIKIKSEHIILWCILALALAFRLFYLNDSIWFDESYTIWMTNLSASDMIRVLTKPAFTPPLYYLILHYWINIFGDSVASLRIPSIFFGWLSVWMIYLLARNLFDKRVGLASAALLAFSFFQVFYSEEIRMYSLLSLLSITSAYFLLRLKTSFTPFNYWGYIFSTVALLYSHNYAMFVVFAQSLYFLITVTLWKENTVIQFRTFLFSQIIIGLCFLPWAIFLFDLTESWRNEGYWTVYPSLKVMINLANLFAGSKYILPLLIGLTSIAAIWPLISKYLFRKGAISKDYTLDIEGLRTHNREIIFLLLWLIIPIVIPYLMSVFVNPAFTERYMIASQAPFSILIAKIVFSIGRNWRVQTMLMIVLLSLQLFNLTNYFNQGGRYKRDWKGVSAYINTHAKPGDQVLFFGGEFQLPFDYYVKRQDIFRRNILGKKRTFYSQFVYEKNDIRMSDMKTFLPKQDRVWVVARWRGIFKKNAFVFKRHLEQTEYIEKTGLDIYLFEKKRTSSQQQK